jgi:hypothetical protein
VTAAGARTSRKPKPKPNSGKLSCEHFPEGGKGPFSTAARDVTGKCWDEIRKGQREELQVLSAQAQACPNSSDAERSQAATIDVNLSDGWKKQIAASKKAQAAYWKAEKDWYESQHRSKTADKIDAVVTGVGKSGLAADGFPVELEAVASALRNNSCEEVTNHLAKANTAVSNVGDAVDALKQALGAL